MTAGSRAGTWHYREPMPGHVASMCPATEGHVTLGRGGGGGGCQSREQLNSLGTHVTKAYGDTPLCLAPPISRMGGRELNMFISMQ